MQILHFPKMLTRCLFIATFVLCVGVVRMDLGEGEAMDEEMFFECFVYFNCMGGEEKFKEIEACYDILGKQIFDEAFDLLKNASQEVGEKMEVFSSDAWVLRSSYCPKSIETMKKVFDAFSVLMIEEFTYICSEKSLKEKCSTYESGLGCAFTLMEEAATNEECKIE